jgi:hypothetical protein
VWVYDDPHAMIGSFRTEITMRAIVTIGLIAMLGSSLSGCAVAEVASAGVSAATTVVSTTVDVAGDVVSGVADTVSGKSDSDKDKDKKKPDGSDDGDKK